MTRDFTDESEKDVEYATGAKDVEDEHYGWACAITSQEISYAYGPGPGKDMPPSVEELPAREEEDLLLTMIVMYQKYTCMIFNEKIHQRFTSGAGKVKKEKNRNESRIRYLERMLKTAVIVEDESKEDEIGLNNTVEVYCEDDEEVETYRIVTSVRGSSLNGLVSIESPLGKALLGHKEGDRVFIKVNDDFGYYVIVKKVIKTQSEDEDHIRSF